LPSPPQEKTEKKGNQESGYRWIRDPQGLVARLEFSHHYVENVFFNKVLNALRKHVTQTIQKAPQSKFLYLCGGFSNSHLVKLTLTQVCQQNNVILKTPRNTSTTVLLGAIEMGLSKSSIRSRTATHSLGFQASVLWDETYAQKGGQKVVFINNGKEVDYCNNLFEPFVKVGDSVASNFEHKCFFLPAHDNQKTVHMNIYQSDDRNTQFVLLPQCKKLTSIEVKLPPPQGVGLDRSICVTVSVGDAVFNIFATDLTTKQTLSTQIDFVSAF
jgi:hypothetical protein